MATPTRPRPASEHPQTIGLNLGRLRDRPRRRTNNKPPTTKTTMAAAMMASKTSIVLQHDLHCGSELCLRAIRVGGEKLFTFTVCSPSCIADVKLEKDLGFQRDTCCRGDGRPSLVERANRDLCLHTEPRTGMRSQSGWPGMADGNWRTTVPALVILALRIGRHAIARPSRALTSAFVIAHGSSQLAPRRRSAASAVLALTSRPPRFRHARTGGNPRAPTSCLARS
jgi:hypothetical protein